MSDVPETTQPPDVKKVDSVPLNNSTCVPARFQKGDHVSIPGGRSGIVTAVGQQAGTLIYRVGRNQYWHEWQLRRTK